MNNEGKLMYSPNEYSSTVRFVCFFVFRLSVEKVLITLLFLPLFFLCSIPHHTLSVPELKWTVQHHLKHNTFSTPTPFREFSTIRSFIHSLCLSLSRHHPPFQIHTPSARQCHNNKVPLLKILLYYNTYYNKYMNCIFNVSNVH